MLFLKAIHLIETHLYMYSLKFPFILVEKRKTKGGGGGTEPFHSIF